MIALLVVLALAVILRAVGLLEIRRGIEYSQAFGCLACLQIGTVALFLGRYRADCLLRIELLTPIHRFRIAGRLGRALRWGAARDIIGAAVLVALAMLVQCAHAEEPAPSPKPPVWTVSADIGPATISTNGETKPAPFARATISGEPWLRWEFGARGDLNRTTNGGDALTIQDFTSFASLEAGAWVRYRLGNSPVTLGGVGAVTWSREDAIASPKDPRLWTAEAIACVDRFPWWTAGGVACLGMGYRGPASTTGGSFSFSATQPLGGPVYLTVDFDLPFNKLPDLAKALPAIAAQVPPRGAAPTPEQVRAAGQSLPVAVRVGVLVRGFTRKF